MIGNRKYWKSYAKEFLQGKWGTAILCMLAAPLMNTLGLMAANGLFPGTDFLSWILGEAFLLIVSLLSMIVSTGYNYMLLNMARGREYRILDLVCMFRKGSDGVLTAGLIMSVIDTVLMVPFYYLVNTTEPAGTTAAAFYEWMQPIMLAMAAATLLSVLVKLPFAMAFYVLADEPEMKGIQALKESMKLMKGHIFQYFVLQISFLPLMVLSLFTFYIGLLWLMPYMYGSFTAFYMDVTGELAQRQERRTREMTGWMPQGLQIPGETGNSGDNRTAKEHRTGDDYDSEA